MYEIAFVAVIAFTAWIARHVGYRQGFNQAVKPASASAASEPLLGPLPSKPGEVNVVMPAKDLEDIAWLADTGFRAWIFTPPNPFRHGERLSHERAEQLASLLDRFERKIVSDLLLEIAENREERFYRYENRIKDLVNAYG